MPSRPHHGAEREVGGRMPACQTSSTMASQRMTQPVRPMWKPPLTSRRIGKATRLGHGGGDNEMPPFQAYFRAVEADRGGDAGR